ncbi:MAG: RNA polymerase sigma-70 factor (ECF subfamily), partial [Limisphaerales bacterium]
MSDEIDSAPGDEFIRQLTEHQAALHGYVLSALGDPHEAKDALQRTNVVLWKKAAKWDPNSRFLS